jgi:hypothetical protein
VVAPRAGLEPATIRLTVEWATSDESTTSAERLLKHQCLFCIHLDEW